MSRRILKSALLAIVVCGLALPVPAKSYTSARSGVWGSTSTWSPAGVPKTGDTVSISHAVTLNTAASINGVTVNSVGSLTLNDGLTVDGPTLVNGAFHGGTQFVTFNGNITVNNGATFDLSSGGMDLYLPGMQLNGTGTATVAYLSLWDASLTVSGVTLNISSSMSLTRSTYAGNSPVYAPGVVLTYQQIAGNPGAEWKANIVADDSLFVELYGSVLTLPGTVADTFYAGYVGVNADASLNQGNVNLVLDGSGGTSIQGLGIQGTLTGGAGDIRLISNGGIFAVDAGGTFAHGSGTVEFNATGFQQLAGPVTLGKLRIVNVFLEGFNTWTIQDQLDMEGTAIVWGAAMDTVYESANLNYIGFTGTVGDEWPAVSAPSQVTLTSSDATLNGGPIAVAAASLQLTNSSITNQDAGIAVAGNITVGSGSVLSLGASGSSSAGSVALADGGQIRTERTISTPGSVPYDLTGVNLGFTSVPTETISVILHGGNVSDVGTRTGLLTGRWWEITSADTTIPSSISLPIDFLAGTPDPYVCNYLGTPGSWTCDRDSHGSGVVTRSSALAYGIFAVGDQHLGTVPVTVSAFRVD